MVTTFVSHYYNFVKCVLKINFKPNDNKLQYRSFSLIMYFPQINLRDLYFILYSPASPRPAQYK